MRRTRDLKKENDFYKSLISEMVQKTGKQLDEKMLQDIVCNTLKTHSTKANFDMELDSVDIIASIIKDNDTKL